MIGLGTYSFFWEMSERAGSPTSLTDAFAATRAQEVSLFQICDHERLTAMTERELAETSAVARDLGLTIELGTKGVRPEHLRTYLRLADVFGARLVRSMVRAPDSQPTVTEAAAMVREVVPAFRAAGVTLALETYEQVSTPDLVALVEDVGADVVGICLDPGNVVAGLELPRDTVERCAPVTRNVHAKDFAFTRADGWIGFTFTGAPMGTGLHDYSHLRRTVRPRERGINEIVEHWLPWQGDPATTINAEREWTRRALDYLRSTP